MKLKLIIAFFLAGWANAGAQSINLAPAANNLYNTGYNGTTLAGPNQMDTHYTLLGIGPTYQANPLAGGWVGNPSDSQWITISPTSTAGATVTYDYHLVLTNIPAGEKVTISGGVAADDNATILVNGSSTVFSNFAPVVVPGNYGAFAPFTDSFVSGPVNSIDFVVTNNGGGPTGLNVEINGVVVPLTSTVGLGIQFDTAGLDANQTSTANYINRLNAAGVDNACFASLTAALIQSIGPSFGSALDQLTPEKLGVFSSIAFDNASFSTQNLDDYLAHRRDAHGNLQVSPGQIDTSGLSIGDPSLDPSMSQVRNRLVAWNPAPLRGGMLSDSASPMLLGAGDGAANPWRDPWNFFVSGNVVLGQNFSQQDLQHSGYNTSGVQVGADYQLNSHFLVGTELSYEHTDTTLDTLGSSATIDSYSPGIYASYAQNGWFANALAAYAYNAYTEQRDISIAGFNETAQGAPGGNQETGNLDGGYEFHRGNWTFGPTAGIQYVHLDVDGFNETGGCSTDLAVDHQDAESLRSRLGGRVSYSLDDLGMRFTPFLDASWQHEFLDGGRGIVSSFSDLGGGDFTVNLPDESGDSALVTVGLDLDVNRTVTAFTNYQAQAGQDNYFGQSVQAGVRLAF
jgi:uncharacterized protein YhjY with autotransporter beta-barrel domain